MEKTNALRLLDQQKVSYRTHAYESAGEAYIERKLFTVNTGHATLAYAAYQKGYTTILDATQDPSILALVQAVLDETGALMVDKHGFDAKEHRQYVEKTINRFKNPAIVDEVVRVARSPLRKLSRHDRFIQPMFEAQAHGLKTTALLEAIENVLAYNSPEDPEAITLQEKIMALGKRQAFSEISGLPIDHPCVQALK